MVHKNKMMQDCISECLSCYKICTETMSHCIEMGGKHAEQKHLTTMADCASICRTAAEFMMRNSHHSNHICDECANICDECATECEKFNDDFMKDCAKHCRACAQACRKMPNQHAT